MQIVEFAEQYVAEKKIARTPVYSATRFVKLMGDISIHDVDDAKLRQFRTLCEQHGLKPWTVRGGLKDLRTLIRASGRDVKLCQPGKPQPNPQPVSFDRINAIWPQLATWSRQWLVIAFWTGLRFNDTIRLQKNVAPDTLEWIANKTGHRHRWPVPPWITQYLQPVKLPYTTSDWWCKAIVHAELNRCTTLAGMEKRILPSEIRDTSLREWCRADFHVGQIVHGSKLGTIGHYVDILDVLAPVSHRVQTPACFGAEPDNKADIISIFTALDPQARRMVTEMASRLAR